MHSRLELIERDHSLLELIKLDHSLLELIECDLMEIVLSLGVLCDDPVSSL